MFIKIDSHRQFDNAVRTLGRKPEGYYAASMSGERVYLVDESDAERLAAGRVKYRKARAQDPGMWCKCW